jgi:ATP-dependent DNA helicase RecQ
LRQADAQERDWLRAILGALAKRGTSTSKLFSELALMKERKQFDSLLDGLARAGLISVANDTFRAPDGRDVTYRKVSVTHEGREPDEAALDTVWVRDAVTPFGKRKTERKERKGKREGRGAASSARSREVEFPGGAREVKRVVARPAAIVELNGEQAGIEQRLRAWRKEQAQAAGLPSFFIFSDTVLREIAVTTPASLSELRDVRGVGTEKLERFGAAVLEICRG